MTNKIAEYIKLAEALPDGWEQSHRQLPDGMYSTQVYTPDGETVCTVHWYPKPKIKGSIGTYRDEMAQFIAASRTLGPAMARALIEAEEILESVGICIDLETVHNAVDKALAKIQAVRGDQS